MHEFPRTFASGANEILPFLSTLVDDESQAVVIDAARLRFVAPLGICGLAAGCHVLHERGQAVRIVGLSNSLENFFDRMDVFKYCHIEHEPRVARAPMEDALVEVRCLATEGEANDVAVAIGNAMTGRIMRGQDDPEDPEGMQPRLSERLSLPLNYVLSELLDNAVTHARRDGFGGAQVWVAANYYPSQGLVRMAVVDNGCGFLRSLAGHEKVRGNPTDRHAIATALEPFVSCNREVGILDSSANQGIGLTVSRDIAAASDGHIEVFSGSGGVCTRPQRRFEGLPYWQGSALDVCLSRNRLLELDLRRIVGPYQREPRPRLRFQW